MNRDKTLLSGIGLGALVMYLLDPVVGRRRRARARDRMVHAAMKTGDVMDATARDLVNRGAGIMAETRALFSAENVSDAVLVGRVRAKLGRLVLNPGSIYVAVSGGTVTLRGPVLAHEVKELLRYVGSIRGVKKVEHQLDIHDEAGNVPGLQAGRTRSGARRNFRQRKWAPASRLLAGIAGGTFVASGLKRHAPLRIGAGVLGLGLAITNRGIRRLLRVKRTKGGIRIRKSLTISAPVADVYGYWENFDNFPLFMRNVREVVDLGEGRSHWVVAGPAGMKVEWDAEVTDRRENQALAWRSVRGSVVIHSGIVEFYSNPDGSTRIDVSMSYSPPAGVLGHAIAALFGADPRSEIDEDLIRMKTLIETGNPPHDAADPLLVEAKRGRMA